MEFCCGDQLLHSLKVYSDYISVLLFLPNPVQPNFKSVPYYTNVNWGSHQPDNNQSGALAHIRQSFWIEPCVDFITMVVVAAATLILPHPRGKGRRGQTEVRGQASKLNTLSGIRRL